jgi:hypothetical protein
MPSLRWLAGLAVPVMVGAALVTNPAIATADPVNDSYLAQLRGVGITWPPGHDEALIGMAHLVCDDLGWGSMVNIARATYCPNQRCWAPHC